MLNKKDTKNIRELCIHLLQDHYIHHDPKDDWKNRGRLQVIYDVLYKLTKSGFIQSFSYLPHSFTERNGNKVIVDVSHLQKSLTG